MSEGQKADQMSAEQAACRRVAGPRVPTPAAAPLMTGTACAMDPTLRMCRVLLMKGNISISQVPSLLLACQGLACWCMIRDTPPITSHEGPRSSGEAEGQHPGSTVEMSALCLLSLSANTGSSMIMAHESKKCWRPVG